MKLALADPPYLGRANRWYGDGRGSGRVITSGGRPGRKPDFHPEAAVWDQAERHIELMRTLVSDFDGWAIAGTADSGPLLLREAPSGTRMAVWVRSNAMPAGARVINTYETVLYFVPAERRNRVKGESVRDALVAPHRPSGFLGSKPAEWTHWVLGLLGHDPANDEVTDVFSGSGAVASVIDGLLPLPAANLANSRPTRPETKGTNMSQIPLAKVEDCPDPSVHQTFRYCPYCEWHEPLTPAVTAEDVARALDPIPFMLSELTAPNSAHYKARRRTAVEHGERVLRVFTVTAKAVSS